MKILVVTDLSSTPHSVRPEAEIFLAWARAGHRVIIYSPASVFDEAMVQAGIERCIVQRFRKLQPGLIAALRRKIDDAGVDIVFATNSRTIPNAAFACLGKPARLVAYRGTISGLYRHDPTAYFGVLHPRIDAVACVSQAVSETVRKRVRPGCRVATIYKGHELAWYREAPADPGALGIPDRAFIVAAAASFRPSKGLHILLQACASLSELEHLHVLVIGSGAFSDPYDALVNASGMSARIHRLGFRDDGPALVAAANLLVQPSVAGEGLPRTVVEALAYGIPALVTDTGGAQEVIDHGQSGWIVPKGDAEAIADAIRHAYRNPEKTADMRDACRAVISGKLSCERGAAEYLALFAKLHAQQ